MDTDCDEAWKCFDYPDMPSQEQCDAASSSTGDKYAWVDTTARQRACSTLHGNKKGCENANCYYHAKWNSCMPFCNSDLRDSPGADNCFACTFTLEGGS